MIVLRNLTKEFNMRGQRKIVADNINAVFPTGVSVALLGRNGAGKSTLLRMIAGTTHPTSGEVLSTGSVSYPVGLAGSLHPDLTGAQNTRFVARIYGADTDALMHWVEEFAELGTHFHLPVRSYSSGMRGRLSFGINMGLSFETYLIDEITAVGDAAFKRKSRSVFLDRMENAGALFVSHSMGLIREMCTAGAMLEEGRLTYYDDVEQAIEHYNQSLSGNRVHAAPPLPREAVGADFPRDAQMLFGIGLPGSAIDWLGDCLRRHRPCLFAKDREPHYFDIRAGISPKVLASRHRIARKLARRLAKAKSGSIAPLLAKIRRISDLLAIHATLSDGPRRHQAYVDYLLERRRSQAVICDFTPDYARLPPEALHEMAGIGNARFVLVLRDPATRLWAELHAGLPPAWRNPETLTDVAWELIRAVIDTPARLFQLYPLADYEALFRRLEQGLPPERLLVLFHEQLSEGEGLDRLTDSLLLPPMPAARRPASPAEHLPPLPADNAAYFHHLLASQYTCMQARFGNDLPASWQTPDTGEAG